MDSQEVRLIPDNNDPKAWARYYVKALGWSLVPLRDGKIPIIKDWDKLRKTPLSIEMLDWYIDQGYSLGSVTGDSLFYVLDDDYPKHPEVEKPEWLELDSTVISRTGNGGFHYYFKPWKMPNKQGKKIDKLQTLQVDLRGSNGQVAVPPFNGYTWVKPPTVEAYDSLPTKKTIPAQLMELFNLGRGLDSSYASTSDFFEILGANTHRDPLLFERAFVLWQKHFEQPSFYTEDRIAGILNDFNSQFSPPKPPDIVAKCFEQGRAYAKSLLKQQGKLPPSDPATIDLSKDIDLAAIQKQNYPRLKIGFDIIDYEGIPSGMNLIIGTPGSGKSWFAIWLMKAIHQHNGLSSVFFSLEMDYRGILRRMVQSYAGLSLIEYETGSDASAGEKLIRQMKPIIQDYTGLDGNEITPTAFVSQVQAFYAKGYRVFFFDHLHEIPGVMTNDKNQQVIETWGDVFKSIRNSYDDIWLFILVQPNKEGYKKEFLTKENTAGSAAILNKCDFFLSVNRVIDKTQMNDHEMDKPVRLWIDKNRRGSVDKTVQPCVLTKTGNFVEAPWEA